MSEAFAWTTPDPDDNAWSAPKTIGLPEGARCPEHGNNAMTWFRDSYSGDVVLQCRYGPFDAHCPWEAMIIEGTLVVP